jgi:hypothetical protein
MQPVGMPLGGRGLRASCSAGALRALPASCGPAEKMAGKSAGGFGGFGAFVGRPWTATLAGLSQPPPGLGLRAPLGSWGSPVGGASPPTASACNIIPAQRDTRWSAGSRPDGKSPFVAGRLAMQGSGWDQCRVVDGTPRTASARGARVAAMGPIDWRRVGRSEQLPTQFSRARGGLSLLTL